MFLGLNPIKHVWDVLLHSLAAQRPTSMTNHEHKGALVQEWKCLPLELIKSQVNSVNQRCENCEVVRSDHTPY